MSENIGKRLSIKGLKKKEADKEDGEGRSWELICS